MSNAIKLAKENEELRKQLAEKNQQLQAHGQKIQTLEEYIRSLKHKQFGSSSEKCDDQIALFNEAEQDCEEIVTSEVTNNIDVLAHKRKKKKQKRNRYI